MSTITTTGTNYSGDYTTGYTAVSPILQEPDAFRDFIIHMCGFVDNDAVPSKEAWDKLRKRVKKVAAEYVLARRDDQVRIDREKARYQEQLELELAMQQPIATTSTTTGVGTSITGIGTSISGSGIAGATTLADDQAVARHRSIALGILSNSRK